MGLFEPIYMPNAIVPNCLLIQTDILYHCTSPYNKTGDAMGVAGIYYQNILCDLALAIVAWGFIYCVGSMHVGHVAPLSITTREVSS